MIKLNSVEEVIDVIYVLGEGIEMLSCSHNDNIVTIDLTTNRFTNSMKMHDNNSAKFAMVNAICEGNENDGNPFYFHLIEKPPE